MAIEEGRVTFFQLDRNKELPEVEEGAEVYFSVDKLEDSSYIIELSGKLIDAGVESIYFSGEKKESWNHFFELVETDRFPDKVIGEVIMSTLCEQDELYSLVERSKSRHIWYLYDTRFGDLLLKKERG